MTARYESIQPARFHEDVSRQIARSIVRGDLRPLDALPSESVLIEQFRVSRAVVREALRTLQQRGLIEMAQGKRTIVTDEGRWDLLDPLVLATYREVGRIKPLVRDFLWIRSRLEPEIAAEVALRVDAPLLAELEAILDDMEAHQDRVEEFFKFDMAYHNRLATAVDNRVLGRLMGTISYLFFVSRDLALDGIHTPSGALRWHRQVQKALRAGDPNGARAAMQGHLAWTSERIMAQLEDR